MTSTLSRLHHPRTARFFFASSALVTLLSAGCADEPAGSSSTGADDVTSIQTTTAKQQSIANCWLYATAAWTESLHLRVDEERLDVSEAYWSYFHWFDQLTDRSIVDYGYAGSLFPTGWWGTGVELMRTRGWMNEADFLPDDGGEIYSARQKRALEALQASLVSGPLSTPAGRADRAVVIAELNRAWGLTPAVAQMLADAFGPTYERTLLSAELSLEGTSVHRPSEIGIGHVVEGGADATITMADAIGAPAPGATIGSGQREGRHAWSQVLADADFSAGGRALTVRAQKALNQNAPVWITWWADDSKIAESGTYRVGTGSVGAGAYLHASLIIDYEVDVPGFGLLPAGVPETRPEALEAALGPDATVNFFRIKNPWWGSYELDGQRTPFADGPGYHDVDLDYLRMRPPSGAAMLHSLIVPNDPDLALGGAP